jgi:phosphoribosylanthranilate isomerase
MANLSVLRQAGLVKICGIREPGHAVAAVEAGADLLGLMFAKSRRQVSRLEAARIVSEVRSAYGDQSPLFTGVFVDADAATINELVSQVGLDVVQLHGAEIATVLLGIQVPVIRPIRTPPGSTMGSIASTIENQQLSDEVPALFFIDAYDPVMHGGTGKRADWPVARAVAARWPLMLAGGLTPENVAEAIDEVRPAGVDVSSGVETNAVKDPEKVREFVANAKRAFARLDSPGGSGKPEIGYPVEATAGSS